MYIKYDNIYILDILYISEEKKFIIYNYFKYF